MKPLKLFASLTVLISALMACASAPQSSVPLPGAMPPETARVTTPVFQAPPAATPPPVVPGITHIPDIKSGPTLPLPQAVVELPVSPIADDIQALHLLEQLLPKSINDRNGWRNEIRSAFADLKIPGEAQYFCAAIAVIEQESGWQSDPVVPDLDKIVWKEIGKRADKYHLPMLAVKAALLKPSSNGLSYKARIDALKTEKQMNDLFEEMVADARKLGLPLDMKNPIRTGGPMQVSVDFAEGHIRVWPYPYYINHSIRSEVFSRRGGIYFGVADLLQYRVSYPQMVFRFADYNAGRYSSRNAAFQSAVRLLSHKKMELDGDLLMYESRKASATEAQLLTLAGRLGMSTGAIERDLKLEKTEGFSQTALYKRVFEVASTKAAHSLPQQVIPQIRLISPKITRKLTTEWFARRVDGRYQACMARLPSYRQ